MNLLNKGLTTGGAYRLVPILVYSPGQGSSGTPVPRFLGSYSTMRSVYSSNAKNKSLIRSSSIHPKAAPYSPS